MVDSAIQSMGNKITAQKSLSTCAKWSQDHILLLSHHEEERKLHCTLNRALLQQVDVSWCVVKMVCWSLSFKNVGKPLKATMSIESFSSRCNTKSLSSGPFTKSEADKAEFLTFVFYSASPIIISEYQNTILEYKVYSFTHLSHFLWLSGEMWIITRSHLMRW